MTLTDENFQAEVLKNGKPVLVGFCADWCGASHIMTPVMDELAADFAGCARVVRMGVEHNPETAVEYGVHTTPTFVFFVAGEAVDWVVGLASKQTLAEKLSTVIGLRE